MPEPFPRVTETSVDPFRAICRFRVRRNKFFLSSGPISTGFLIGKHHILTAAHNYARFGWWPFGSKVTGATARFGAHGDVEVHEIRAFYRNMRTRYPSKYGAHKYYHDYCLITLSSEMKNITPLQLAKGDNLNIKVGQQVWSAGYQEGSDYMRSDTGKITKIENSLVTYDMDTEGGLSGAPVWIMDDEGMRHVIGIHVRGMGPIGSAKLISPKVHKELIDWGWNTKH